ncbi:uncharacterized protein LOC126664627 isoform X2 [Mercurialis annua]|uniref:uncharacterized protein LOC126664627 isoform X2 n=1 Tax=Mercurialis annua TaxID=3986 RepID=UPI002160C373|nr:uncharacterized protein LOC126664627 isoform X2 [Mercurialis annua]
MIKHNIMEPKSIQFRHPELEESFSFTSCRDFNSSSSFSFFSDNDDGEDDGGEESYIEIAFERPDRFNKDDEMELRISFSSLSAETKASLSSSNSSSLSTFTFSSSFTESQRSREVQSTEEAGCDFRVEKTVKGKVQFPVVNRLVNTFVSSFRLSPEVNVGDAETKSPAANHLEIIPSSTKRRSKITTTTTINTSGIMMNFFVKFRALKLKTLLASFLKASQTSPVGRKTEDRSIIKYRNRVKPVDKGPEKEKKLNLEGIKGYMLEAMSSINRNTTTKSCPVSTESSPLHQRFLSESYKMSASDNSIQAAIAHCKKSFGPNV